MGRYDYTQNENTATNSILGWTCTRAKTTHEIKAAELLEASAMIRELSSKTKQENQLPSFQAVQINTQSSIR